MKQPEKIDLDRKRLLGLKLLSFRKKLALAIGRKKITQSEFGEMYGSYSGRVIASYELGDSEMPAAFLYDIWQRGHSIDNIFGEGPIPQTESESGRKLYEQTSLAILRRMTDTEQQRLLKEIGTHDKNTHDRPDTDTIDEAHGKGKAGSSKTRTTKKR